jgi:hypothetical protein
MALLIHDGIRGIEQRLERLMKPARGFGQRKPDPLGLARKAEKLRSRFRKNLRDIADVKVETKSSSNGDSSFRIWMAGFECARNIDTPDVYYFAFGNSNSSVIVHSVACREKTITTCAKFAHLIQELEQEGEVAEVMLS